MSDVLLAFPELEDLSDSVQNQLGIEAIYDGYLQRQQAEIDALRRDEALRIPEDLDYGQIGGLSNEVRAKLIQIRPATLGQAGRIEGVTPGALTALLAHVKRQPSKRQSA